MRNTLRLYRPFTPKLLPDGNDSGLLGELYEVVAVFEPQAIPGQGPDLELIWKWVCKTDDGNFAIITETACFPYCRVAYEDKSVIYEMTYAPVDRFDMSCQSGSSPVNKKRCTLPFCFDPELRAYAGKGWI